MILPLCFPIATLPESMAPSPVAGYTCRRSPSRVLTQPRTTIEKASARKSSILHRLWVAETGVARPNKASNLKVPYYLPCAVGCGVFLEMLAGWVPITRKRP